MQSAQTCEHSFLSLFFAPISHTHARAHTHTHIDLAHGFYQHHSSHTARPHTLPPAQRLSDMTPEEASDLFCSAHKIAGPLEKEYAATSMTLAIQDGKDAGQTVAVSRGGGAQCWD